MDIKYYINKSSGTIEAINMDNIKRIWVDWHGNDNPILATVYFDDINVDSIKREKVEMKVNEITSSEDKILEIYNSEIIRKVFKEENSKIIFKNGFNTFKEYLQSSDVNLEVIIKSVKLLIVRVYVEQLKNFDTIGGDKTLSYLISFVLSSMYNTHIKQL